MEDTLTAAFRRTARSRSDAAALRFESYRYTHGDMDRLSDRLAAGLARQGITPGDRVGVFLPNSPALILAHLAIGKVGAVRLCLNPAYTADEMRFLLADAQPRLVMADPSNGAVLQPAGWSGAVWTPTGDWNPFSRQESDAAPPAPSLSGGQPALMAYTSGTTGKPKGAVLTHANLLSNIRTLAELWHWNPADRLLLALPMFHMHGLGLGLHGTLWVGSEMILHRRFEAGAVLDDLERERCTLFMGVPTLYERLLAEDRRADLRSMRLFISGSAPLAPETWHAFRRRYGHEILERYGLTETVMNASNPYEGARRPGTVGPPLPGVSINLDPPGEGEICVKGPNVFPGYWRQPEANREAFDTAGYFRTGDIGRFDPDGYLVISGRKKELILTGGFNVYPREVEECLSGMPGIAECAVVGRPDREWGENVVAFVVRAPGAEIDEAAVRAHAERHLTKYKVPRRVTFLEALPRNAMGKLLKETLRTLSRSDA